MPQSIPSPRSDSSDGEHKSTSSNSDSIIESQQTIQKKKKQRVRKPKPIDGLDDTSSRASSPAFSDAYIKEKENEAMEEEITRAIAVANRNGDLNDLTNLTSLFGEGSMVEIRSCAPEARKYLKMVNKRDEMKLKFETQDVLQQSTAASPTRRRRDNDSEDESNQRGKGSPLGSKKPKSKIYVNSDGTPFSRAQIQSSKRRVAAKLRKLSPPPGRNLHPTNFPGKDFARQDAAPSP